jgi:hypothetical protein
VCFLALAHCQIWKAFDYKLATMHFTADSLWTRGVFEAIADLGEREGMEDASDEMVEVDGDEIADD